MIDLLTKKQIGGDRAGNCKRAQEAEEAEGDKGAEGDNYQLPITHYRLPTTHYQAKIQASGDIIGIKCDTCGNICKKCWL